MDTLEKLGDALSLGVEGLTEDAAGWMGRGRIYGLNVRIPSLRFPLVAAAIESALASGTPCTVVLRSKPEAYLTQINTPERIDIDAHLASGALGVLVMREDFGKRMFQLGAARFTRELSGFGVAPGSLVIFEHAGDLLNLRDKGLATQQVEALDAWCQEQGCTGLLVFSGNPERNTVPVTDLMDALAGLAVLEPGQGYLTIDFPFWRCNDRLSGCRHVTLHMDAGGHYRVGFASDRDAIVGEVRRARGVQGGLGHVGDATRMVQSEAGPGFDPAALVRAPGLAIDDPREMHGERRAHPAVSSTPVQLRSFEGRVSAGRDIAPARAYTTAQATRVRTAPAVEEEA